MEKVRKIFKGESKKSKKGLSPQKSPRNKSVNTAVNDKSELIITRPSETQNLTPSNEQRASISLQTYPDAKTPSQPLFESLDSFPGASTSSLKNSANNNTRNTPPSKLNPPSKISAPSPSRLSKSVSTLSNASTVSTVSTVSINTVNTVATVTTVANQDQSTDHNNKKANGANSEKNQAKSQDPKVDELWKKLDGQENPAKTVVAAKIQGPTLHMRVNSPGPRTSQNLGRPSSRTNSRPNSRTNSRPNSRSSSPTGKKSSRPNSRTAAAPIGAIGGIQRTKSSSRLSATVTKSTIVAIEDNSNDSPMAVEIKLDHTEHESKSPPPTKEAPTKVPTKGIPTKMIPGKGLQIAPTKLVPVKGNIQAPSKKTGSGVTELKGAPKKDVFADQLRQQIFDMQREVSNAKRREEDFKREVDELRTHNFQVESELRKVQKELDKVKAERDRKDKELKLLKEAREFTADLAARPGQPLVNDTGMSYTGLKLWHNKLDNLKLKVSSVEDLRLKEMSDIADQSYKDIQKLQADVVTLDSIIIETDEMKKRKELAQRLLKLIDSANTKKPQEEKTASPNDPKKD